MALLTKRVIISLLSGILIGTLIINNFSPFLVLQALSDLFVQLLSTPWMLKTFGFMFLMGALMHLMQRSGGVDGFVHMLTHRLSLVKSDRAALILVYIIGVVLFIETSISVLVAGAVGRPVCDAQEVSRAKLAYVCDSTSAPVGSLIMFNGYGALMLGLITAQMDLGLIKGESIAWLLEALSMNFYSILALVVTFIVIWFRIDIGPMRHTKVIHEIAQVTKGSNPWYMIAPVILMLSGVFFFLYLTGDGDILKGSGSSAIFYTMVMSVTLVGLFFILKGVLSVKEVTTEISKGIKSMLGINVVLLLSFGIGQVTTDMHTGTFLASYANMALSPLFLSALIFILAAIISFSTGTSWGTFSIMIPIAIPLAVALDADIALVIAAVISGGIFGDHCSPISDTTIVTSMATGCDHIEHVKTQLPYALIVALFSVLLFILFAWIR